MAYFSGRQEDRSQKKLSKTDLPFRCCKIVLRNTLFIYGRKNGRLFCFVCFVATLSDFGLLKKKIEVLIELRKMLLRNKLFSMYGLGIAQPLRNPDLQIYWIYKDAIDLTKKIKCVPITTITLSCA